MLDSQWFGLSTLAVVTGMITFPFGYNLLYMRALNLPDVSMMDFYHGILPYIPAFIITIILCVLFPQLVLWLPSIMK